MELICAELRLLEISKVHGVEGIRQTAAIASDTSAPFSAEIFLILEKLRIFAEITNRNRKVHIKSATIIATT